MYCIVLSFLMVENKLFYLLMTTLVVILILGYLIQPSRDCYMIAYSYTLGTFIRFAINDYFAVNRQRGIQWTSCSQKRYTGCKSSSPVPCLLMSILLYKNYH
jgi:hypothetical protein